MTCIDILKKLLFTWRGVSQSTIDAADSENILRSTIEHRKASERAAATMLHGEMVNGKLRESVRRARTSAFADLEHSIGRRHHG
jgi:hypothetical protein